MRPTIILIAIFTIFTFGCAQEAPDPETESAAVDLSAEMPDDDAHRGLDSPDAEGGHMSMGTNTEIELDEAVAASWSGLVLRVVDRENETTERFEIPLGQSLALGDTGLTAAAVSFIPDFVMGEDGITSRSAEANNPAAKVVISEEGAEDFEGWLFATMPEIHPYPHDRYHVLLEGGLPTP